MSDIFHAGISGARGRMVDVVASVDEKAVYSANVERATTELVFDVQRVEEEWRIAELPPGLLLTEGTFAAVFRAVPLAFLTQDATGYVPDVRYVPARGAPRYAVGHLLEGPMAWLAPAVTTAIPGTAVVEAVNGVVVDDSTGTVEVHLVESGVPITGRTLLYAQLRETLLSLPGVREVALWIGQTRYEPGTGADLPARAAAVGTTMVAVSGLTTLARDIMLILLDSRDNTASLESIKAHLGEPGPIKHEEQLLLQRGYIDITGRGRKLNERGVRRALDELEALRNG